MEQAVTEAVRILREGGVILYPTDTVWGIGCDATNAEAVERIYRLKRSENKKSMLVLCATPDMVVRYVHKAPGIAFEVQELATMPLTLILPGAWGVAANLIPEEGRSAYGFPTMPSARLCCASWGAGSFRLRRTSGAKIRPATWPKSPARSSTGWIMWSIQNSKANRRAKLRRSSFSMKPESSGSSANKAPTELRPLFTIYQAESLSGSLAKGSDRFLP